MGLAITTFLGGHANVAQEIDLLLPVLKAADGVKEGVDLIAGKLQASAEDTEVGTEDCMEVLQKRVPFRRVIRLIHLEVLKGRVLKKRKWGLLKGARWSAWSETCCSYFFNEVEQTYLERLEIMLLGGP